MLKLKTLSILIMQSEPLIFTHAHMYALCRHAFIHESRALLSNYFVRTSPGMVKGVFICHQ